MVGAYALTLPEGVSHTAWSTDEYSGTPYDFSQKVTGDLKLYATTYSEGLSVRGGVVVGYQGGSTVVIPSVYNGETVTAIGEDAFLGNKTIESVKLPDTVTTIGKNAFYRCEYLVEINLTKEITSVGAYAFYACERLKYVCLLYTSPSPRDCS